MTDGKVIASMLKAHHTGITITQHCAIQQLLQHQEEKSERRKTLRDEQQ